MSPIRALLVVVVAALVLAGDAVACVCIDEPMSDRLDGADAAVIGHVVANGEGRLRGAPQLLLTVQVDQRVKGDVGEQIVVRSPLRTDCDVPVPPATRTVGLLLTEGPDETWLATLCSVVGPAELAAAGGEPRGGAIKVVVGLAILAVVLFWAVRRLRRGARPQLPGAPET
jgi:hypothetical protein